MGVLSFESTNPTLSAARALRSDTRGGTATLTGIADKTAALVGITAVTGALAYGLIAVTGGALLMACLASLLVGGGIAWHLSHHPTQAQTLAPIYAGIEGVFLGLCTKSLDQLLIAKGIGVAGGSLALPAFVITVSCVVAMLGLYRAGILRPTERFKSVVMTLTLGVVLAYLTMLVLSLFGVTVPYLSLSSALRGGQEALFGLGLNAAILVLASMWLVIDFGQIDEIVAAGKPRSMEWYGGFILLVTLAWIYYEAVKLSFRLAMLFGRRR